MHAKQNENDIRLLLLLQFRKGKESDSNMFHNRALAHRELHPEKSPLSQLVLGFCPQHNNHHIRQNQIIRKLFGTMERINQKSKHIATLLVTKQLQLQNT